MLFEVFIIISSIILYSIKYGLNNYKENFENKYILNSIIIKK